MKFFRCSTSDDASPIVDESPSFYKRYKGVIWSFVLISIIILGKIGKEMNEEKNKINGIDYFQKYFQLKCNPGSVWPWPRSVANENTISYVKYKRYPDDEFKPYGFDLIFQRYQRVYGVCKQYEPDYYVIVRRMCPEGLYFNSNSCAPVPE